MITTLIKLTIHETKFATVIKLVLSKVIPYLCVRNWNYLTYLNKTHLLMDMSIKESDVLFRSIIIAYI